MSSIKKSTLPAGWAEATVGALGHWIGGGTPSKSNPSFWNGGSIPWISPKDMKSSRISQTEDVITPLAVESSTTNLLNEGAVVVVTRSGILRRTLPVAVTAVPATINQDLKGLTPHPGIDATYVHYAFRAFEQEILDECVKDGTTVQSVDFQKFLQFTIPLAPLAEQYRIVAEVETQLTRLDVSVAALKRAQANLKRYRAAVLKAACEGRLVTQLAELLDDTDKRGGRSLPDGWRYAKLGELARIGTGATPLRSNLSYYEGGEIPWVTSGALNDAFVRSASEYVTDKALRETNLKLYPVHTLLVAMYGEGKTRGKCSELMMEATTNQAIAAIVLENEEAVIRQFVKIFLLSHYESMRQQASGGVQPNLNLGIISSIRVPVPPLIEQHRIVEEVERRLSVVEAMEKTVAHGLKRAERLRQAILRKAFAGELVPQDLADEPASVLLERIRSERAIETSRTKARRIPVLRRGNEQDTERRSLYDVLAKHPKGLDPLQLLQLAGFNEDSVDEFYAQLKAGVDAGKVVEIRTSENGVVLGVPE